MEPAHFESLYPKESRSKEIKKIIDFIKEGNSSQIVSLPGVGRSNLLGLLSFNKDTRELHLGENQKWFHFVLANFSEIRKRPLIDATKFIFLSLAESLRERKVEEYKKVNELFNESLKSGDELVLFQGLKKAIEFLSVEKELTVVFLFDRFEEYVPMLTPGFFTNLRSLRNLAKYRFSVVFSTNRPIEDVIEPEIASDFYEFFVDNVVFLPIYDDIGLKFRLSYLEKATGRKIDEKVLPEIIKLTGGHNKLTRISVEAYFSESTDKNLRDFLLTKNRVKGVLLEIYRRLTPQEIELLENNQESPFLVKVGLLKNGKITIPLFEDYLNLSKTEQKEIEKIVLDETKNEIRKGEIVISDNLTSSEFKLLSFMLKNQDKVLGRDEIISSVWEDLQSTVGVTEQALDQLIFRLRKKIEENPSSPTHLQTIKGRGFKFVV